MMLRQTIIFGLESWLRAVRIVRVDEFEIRVGRVRR